MTMKTPEEIKKELANCTDKTNCSWCPRSSICALEANALAYIQQLEQERDALIAALKQTDVDCEYCKHVMQNNPHCDAAHGLCERCTEIENCKCRTCSRLNSNWEWCGVKHE